ncbi:hypothetical protein ACI5KX_05370 [Erythrobacter sp. GH1-10]|uniref:hypothetical protein n=1 Tax=Erythrobacter sp. GH1-10 TaxID=3349334 RepID=UPI003877CEF4
MKKIIFSLAAASLVSAPVVAQSLPASAPVEGESELEGGAGIVAAALIAGIVAIGVLAFTNDDDDIPVSP